jgi:hypothetical protein
MTEFLEKYSKIIYIVLSLLCIVVAYISKQYYIFVASPILVLMAIGVLDGREDEKQHFFYEQLLEIFEKKEDIESTKFYFSDDPYKRIHTIGYDSNLEKPYHARYFDEEDIHYFSTAKELFNAPVYENESIKDRWKNLIIIRISKRDMRLSSKNKK